MNTRTKQKMGDFEACRFDFRIDAKNGLTPSKRRKSRRRGSCYNTLFKCKTCGKLFDTRPALLSHKLVHNAEDWKCPICGFQCANKLSLTRHFTARHGINPILPKSMKSEQQPSSPQNVVAQNIGIPVMQSSSNTPSYMFINVPLFVKPEGAVATNTTTSEQGQGCILATHQSCGMVDNQAVLLGGGAGVVADTGSRSVLMKMENGDAVNIAAHERTPSPLNLHVDRNQNQLVDSANVEQMQGYQDVYYPNDEVLDLSMEKKPKAENVQQNQPNTHKESLFRSVLETGLARSSLPVLPTDVSDGTTDDVKQSHSELDALQDSTCASTPNASQRASPAQGLPKDLAGQGQSEASPAVAQNAQQSRKTGKRQRSTVNLAVEKLWQKKMKVQEESPQPMFMQCENSDITGSVCREGLPVSQASLAMEASPAGAVSSTGQQEIPQFMKVSTDLPLPYTSNSGFPLQLLINGNTVSTPVLGQSFINTGPLQIGNSVQGQVLASNNPVNQLPPGGIGRCKHNCSEDGTCSGHPVGTFTCSLNQEQVAPLQPTKQSPIMESKPPDQDFYTVKFHTCRVCKQLFQSAEEMWEHALTHEETFKHQCNLCPFTASSKVDLIYHKISQHEDASHAENLKDLTDKYLCNHCGKRLTSYTGYRSHLAMHDATREKQFICPQDGCEWKFFTKQELKAHHDQVHLKIKPFVCKFHDCSKAFANLSKLKRHMVAHTEERPLVCEYPGCLKMFKDGKDLKQHMVCHAEEKKPLQCEHCDYSCRRHSAMDWHMRSTHSLHNDFGTKYTDSENTGDEGPEEHEVTSQDAFPPNSSVHDIQHAWHMPAPYNGEDQLEGTQDSRNESTRSQLVSDEDQELSVVEATDEDNNSEVQDIMTDDSDIDAKFYAKDLLLNPGEPLEGSSSVMSENTAEPGINLTISDDISTDCGKDIEDGPMPPSSVVDDAPVDLTGGGNAVSTQPFVFHMSLRNTGMPSTPVSLAGAKQSDEPMETQFYLCKVCKKMFESSESMWAHQLATHEQFTNFQCEHCEFSTTNRVDLKYHILASHAGANVASIKEFLCYVCGKDYASARGLAQHLLAHNKEGPAKFACPYASCTAQLHSNWGLKAHIKKVHLKRHSIACPEQECQRSFDSPSALRNHMAVHTMERPLMCDHPGCDKSFRETKHLKVHKLQHTNEKPLRCHLCDYNCIQRSSMNWHMKSKHGLQKSMADGRTVYV